nr:ribbon-helix-helix protein, CopG family [Candidatus Sigynarchaeum springense]
MSKIISTRVSDDEVKELNEIAEQEHLDRAALIRKFIMDQLKTYRIRKMSEYYRKGLASMQEAATAAKVTIYEMMEYITAERIHPPEETREEMEADLERTKRILSGETSGHVKEK